MSFWSFVSRVSVALLTISWTVSGCLPWQVDLETSGDHVRDGDHAVVLAPDDQRWHPDATQRAAVRIDPDRRHRHEAADPVRMLRDQWQAEPAAHRR